MLRYHIADQICCLFSQWHSTKSVFNAIIVIAVLCSVVNKDLSFKATDLTFKAKAKNLTSEHVQGPL